MQDNEKSNSLPPQIEERVRRFCLNVQISAYHEYKQYLDESGFCRMTGSRVAHEDVIKGHFIKPLIQNMRTTVEFLEKEDAMLSYEGYGDQKLGEAREIIDNQDAKSTETDEGAQSEPAEVSPKWSWWNPYNWFRFMRNGYDRLPNEEE